MQLSSAKVTTRQLDDLCIVDIQGELNAFAENALMDAFNRAHERGSQFLLLNFSGLDYMNSSGIGLLVTLLIRARRQNMRLLACGLTAHYRQIFELTRLNEAITIYAEESDVLADLHPPASVLEREYPAEEK